MPPSTSPLLCDRGRWYLSVPRAKSEDLRHRLRRRGYPSTLCVDPMAADARLELWPGSDPGAAAGALGELIANGPFGR